MKNQILDHRYPIYLRRGKKRIIRFLRTYLTQRHWFHYFYHRLFGHRIMDRKCGYAWCEYCDYHQELYLDDRPYMQIGADDTKEERYFFR